MDDELKNIWKSSTEKGLNQLEKSSMINLIQSEIENWGKMTKHSNYTQGVLIIILIGWVIIFGMVAYTTSDTQSMIGVILCLIPFVYIMIKITWPKKFHQRIFSETYLNYLYKSKKHIRRHKRFYDIILYVSYPLVATGLLLFRVKSFTSIGIVIVEFLTAIGFGIFLYFIHKWALKRFILKRLAKIEKLIGSFKE